MGVKMGVKVGVRIGVKMVLNGCFLVAAVDEIITVCDGVACRDLVQFYRGRGGGRKKVLKWGFKWCQNGVEMGVKVVV